VSDVGENTENEVQAQANSSNKFKSYRVSWVGYVKPAAITFVFVVIFLSCIAGGSVLVSLLFLIPTISSAYYTYYTSSIRLYTTENGVWCERGLLPWDKGSFGIKWRDMEDAVYFMGFGAWLFKSHTIRIRHRFTKSSEVVIKNLANAPDAVNHINSLHQEMIEAGLN